MQLTNSEIVAIDGKNLRRSYDPTSHTAAIHQVSAWATENHLVLGQRKVSEKSNEITAIPELLRLLEIHGCIVTVDAIGCQKEVAEAIRAQGADYALAVKQNQGKLHEDVKDLFAGAIEEHWQDVRHGYVRDVYRNLRAVSRACEARLSRSSADPDQEAVGSCHPRIRGVLQRSGAAARH